MEFIFLFFLFDKLYGIYLSRALSDTLEYFPRLNLFIMVDKNVC